MLSRAVEGKRRQRHWRWTTSPLHIKKENNYNINSSSNYNSSNAQSFYSLHYSNEEEEGWCGFGGDLSLTFCGGVCSGINLGIRDVLRSSVQVLGMSSFGITEKVVIVDGSTYSAKRFRKVKVGKIDFGKMVERVAAMCSKCEYLVPVRAYLYAKRTKLVLCNYYPMGSLADLLTGARDRGHTPLNWRTRAMIILHVARAIAYIHSQPTATDDKRFRTNIHGNIKPSNVFITTNFSARLSDYGFAQIAHRVEIPNVSRSVKPLPTSSEYECGKKKLSQKQDVFNFGVMMLEVLGGARAPHQKHCIEERIEEIREGSCHFFEYFVEGKEKIQACLVLEVALASTHDSPEARPTAYDIVASLNDILITSSTIE